MLCSFKPCSKILHSQQISPVFKASPFTHLLVVSRATFQKRLRYSSCVFTLKLHFKRIVILLVLKKKKKSENFLQLSSTNKTPCTICQKEIPQSRKKKKRLHPKSLGELRKLKLLSNTQVWHQLKIRTMKWNKKKSWKSHHKIRMSTVNLMRQQTNSVVENWIPEGAELRTWVCFGAEVTIEEYLGLQFNRLFHWDGTAQLRFGKWKRVK